MHEFLKHLFPVFLLAGASLSAEREPELPKLSLAAQATISKPADEIQLSVGVVTVDAAAEVALSENNKKMKAIIDALKSAGLGKSEYQTGHFSFRPVYTPYPKNPPEEWKPSIVGYEISNSIAIKTQQLESAGKLIDAATKAGANSIDNIHFSLHDRREFLDEAIQQATANAIHDAETIATAAHVRLVRPLSLTLDQANVIIPQMNTYRFAKMATAEPGTPPIQAGEIEISATINVTYEIAPEVE